MSDGVNDLTRSFLRKSEVGVKLYDCLIVQKCVGCTLTFSSGHVVRPRWLVCPVL